MDSNIENTQNPLVFVECMTFNHVNYIEDAMKGFVMQQTDFPYVAVVVDDASMDGEPEVIKRFLEKEFDMASSVQDETEDYVRVVAKHKTNENCTFVVVFLKYNHYSIQKPKWKYYWNWRKEAKYIALCEGDDYWTDPLKLQKQVDFLEEHEEYSMCFHAAEIKNETKDIEIITCKDIENKDYLTNDIFPGWTVPTASVVYRKDLVGSFPKIKHSEWMKYGDIVLFLKCTHQGKVRGMSEVMSVYRMTESGAVVSQKKEKDCMEKLCLHYRMLMLNFPQLDRKWPKEFIGTYRYSQFKNTSSLIKKVKFLSSTIYYYPALVMGKMLHLLLPSKW